MKRNYYELTFDCCETLQNGRERRVKKKVLIERFTDGKHNGEEECIRRAADALRKEYYYDITYVGTKCTSLIFAEEG